jgi:import receptor subunit TOM20
VYFDYKRRSSVEFRKQLKKSAKKHIKEQKLAAEVGKSELRSKIQTVVKESLENDPLPDGLQEREKFFLAEVQRADELSNAGEAEYLNAALAFYRALRVYPNPVDLLNIYDKTLKEPIMDILRIMILLDPPPAIASALGGAAGPDLAVE